jgi:hypothetical protein
MPWNAPPLDHVDAAYTGDDQLPVHEVAELYDATEAGSMSYLGVDIVVSLGQSGREFNAFLVEAHYLEPGYAPSNRTVVLSRTVIAAPCNAGASTWQQQDHLFSNSAGSRFLLRFVQRCKRTRDGRFVPYLQTTIGCTRLQFEQSRITALRDGRIFDIAPTGYVSAATRSPYSGTIEFASDTYEVVSTVLTVLDVIAMFSGGITVRRFVMKMFKGEALDALVGAAFDYVRDQTGEKAYFVHTGWQFRCRICGTEFHLSHISEGDIVECTNRACRARVRLHFH